MRVWSAFLRRRERKKKALRVKNFRELIRQKEDALKEEMTQVLVLEEVATKRVK
jgi:hypothetical protein